MKITAYQGVSHPRLCDVLGHLTTRHYVAMFDDASYHFLYEAFGWTGRDSMESGTGWVDVKHIINYNEEILSGSLLEIQGSLIRMGGKSITCLYEMFLKGDTNGQVLASNEVTNVYFDTKARKAIAIPEDLKAKASRYLVG